MSLIFSILIFIVVLGVLIFFHELGHFLAAKACGIYVDRFSLGMPPRLIGVRIGETDYCLGALPIGGYVKMAGQEDTPLSEEERQQTYGHVPEHRWFNKKPVWQRFIVVLAGPLMNFVLAVLLYAALAVAGPMMPEWEVSGRIGKVAPDGAAATAPLYLGRSGAALGTFRGEPDAIGWQTGDVVREIDGKAVDGFTDIALHALLAGPDRVCHVVLERPNADGSVTRYESLISPKVLGDEEHPRFGVAQFHTALVDKVIEDMPAGQTGLQPGDIIVRADGRLVDRTTFVEMTEDTPEGGSMRLEVQRGEEMLSFVLQPKTIGRLRDVVFDTASEEAAAWEKEPAEIQAVDEAFRKKTGLQRRDVILAANGEPVTAAQFDAAVRANPGGSLRVTVRRPAILFGAIQREEQVELTLPVDSVRAIGVELGQRTVRQYVPWSQVAPEALRQSYKALALVMRTIEALLARTVSPKDLGGPLMIANATTQAAEEGLMWLVRITAFISINLCVFNLLPLPILDGGLLVIHGIEGIRRRPLNPRFLERFQMVGLFFIIFLMVFVTYHDIRRWVEGLIP